MSTPMQLSRMRSMLPDLPHTISDMRTVNMFTTTPMSVERNLQEKRRFGRMGKLFTP